MNCKTIRSWIVDYGDGALSAQQNARVQAHLASCASCAAAARGMTEVRQLLRGLDPLQTSPQFDARLAARLAHSRPAQRTWFPWLPGPLAPPLLRPALAFGAATFAIAGALFLHPFSAPVAPPPPADDSAFIAQCVALHQRDVAAQPLTDPAASGVAGAHGVWSADTATQDNL